MESPATAERQERSDAFEQFDSERSEGSEASTAARASAAKAVALRLPAFVGCFLAGALCAGVAMLAVHGSGLEGVIMPRPALLAGAAEPAHSLVFKRTRAKELLGELSRDEVQAVAEWFVATTGASAVRNASPSCVWLSGPSAIELFRPPKTAALSYLDGDGPRPPRFARVTAVGPAGTMEYRAGPLEDGRPTAEATLEPLFAPGDLPYTKRPMENHADTRLGQLVVDAALKSLEGLLTEAFGPVFEQFDSFDASQGSIGYFPRNDGQSPAGTRVQIVVFLWTPPAPARREASWLHPVPLTMKLDVAPRDPSDWSLIEIGFCGQGPWAKAEDLAAAYAQGAIRLCPFEKVTGIWDVPQRVTAPSSLHREETNAGVEWGPWSFTVTQRPSTGLALLDVRFHGERVLYELSMQDAQAGYSGDRQSQFFYSDAAFSLSMLSADLKPGVDCPEGAHFLSAPNWFQMLAGGDAVADPTKPRESFWPVCVFEWDEDHTIWRHMQNSEPLDVRGLTRKTVVVRSIATVGNYDYISDVKLREDGEIEVHTRFAGYIESRYYNSEFNPQEANFSTILRPGLAGPVHSHTVAWKADFDIAGSRSNAFRVTKVKSGEFGSHGRNGEALVSKYLDWHYVEQEGIGSSTMVADTRSPGNWAIVDRAAKSAAGNPRGYAVTLSTLATTQVLPDDHPFVKMMPFTKYHLALTKYHDDEYRVTTPYIQFDCQETTKNAQDLDRFLADGEGLMDEDLVAWISVGREHIVRQEDLPLVSNFGAAFSLQPWNFFEQNVAASPPW